MQPSTNYETLRSWYLAKLRKSAIEAQVSGQLTPSALIAADREVIEKLIAERAEAEENQGKPKLASSGAVVYALLLWVFLIIAVLVSLFLFCLADPSILVDMLLVSINPANLMASSPSLPNPMVLAVVQLVFFVYPIVAIPLAYFSKKE
jgi:hypothetical protein